MLNISFKIMKIWILIRVDHRFYELTFIIWEIVWIMKQFLINVKKCNSIHLFLDHNYFDIILNKDGK